MTRLLLFIVVCLGLLLVPVQAQKNAAFIPGEVWKDTDGNPINAHGGGLLYHNGTYYWLGHHGPGGSKTFPGVAVGEDEILGAGGDSHPASNSK